MDPKERVILEESIAAFQATNPGFIVKHTNYPPEQLRTQFLTAAMAGGGPDLVFGPADNAGPFSVAGVIQPIEELFDAEYLASFEPLAFDTLDGHVWTLPSQVGNHLCLIYNRALVDEVPSTLVELLDQAEGLTVDEDGDGRPETYGLVFDSKEPFWLVPFLGAFGGRVMDENSEPTLSTQAMVNALALMKNIRVDRGLMPPGTDIQLAETLFKEGKAAYTINGYWSWGGYLDSGLDFGVTSIPYHDETGLWPAPFVSSRGYSVNANLKGAKLERALETLRYLVSPAVQIRTAHELYVIPSSLEAVKDPAIQNDARIKAAWQQLRRGKRMPVVPEMRAIWDAMRPAYQNVINGEMTPEEAAKAMQADAIKKIKEMKG